MAKNTLKGNLIKEILIKYPKHPTKTLADILYKENPLIFKDAEEARHNIRYYRGESGQKLRESSTFYKDNGKAEKISTMPKMPDSFAGEQKKYKLPVADNNILMISDLHIPYQVNSAVEAAINYGVEHKVNTVFINGDLLDFHHQSRFQADPKKRCTKDEFNACIQFFEYLRYKLPNANVYWLLGNHDIRYEEWLKIKAPMLFFDEYYLLEDRLNLAKHRVKKIDDKTLVKIGKLNVTHGHLLLRGVFAPVNAARGVFMRAKESTIIGHVHKVSEHQETTLNGSAVITYSTGCLCELNPDYSPFANNYMHGFAHIRTESNGDYHVRNFKIINGKIY
jgi:predicted phosphodiesterase